MSACAEFAATPIGIIRNQLLTIPEENGDIRRALRNKFLWHSAICALWCTLILTESYFWGYFGVIADAVRARDIHNALIAWVLMIFCSLPIMKLRYWRWFSDRTFDGVLTSVLHDIRLEMRNPSIGAQGGMIWVLRQNLSIRKTNGKRKHLSFRRRAGEPGATYYTGDRVRHYYGTDPRFMQKLSREDDEIIAERICVMCGTPNEPERTECFDCGFSLPDHVEKKK